jgi:hypothetical protein
VNVGDSNHMRSSSGFWIVRVRRHCKHNEPRQVRSISAQSLPTPGAVMDEMPTKPTKELHSTPTRTVVD